MALILQIVRDNGTVEVDFQSPPFTLVSFTANTPEVRDERIASAFRDGEDVLFGRYNNVTDEVIFIVQAQSDPDALNLVGTVESRVDWILQQFRGGNTMYYLNFKTDSLGLAWRSRIRKIVLEPVHLRTDERFTLLLQAGLEDDQYYSMMKLTVERDYFWEQWALVSVPLITPLNVSPGTTLGVTLMNHNDGGSGHFNYFEWNEVDIVSTLATPVFLEIENMNNSATRLNSFYISRNAAQTPASFVHQLEAETASLYSGASVVTNATIYSGASGQAISVNKASADAWTQMMYWDLDTTFLTHAGGRWFKILGRFVGTVSTAAEVQLTTTLLGLTTLQEGRIAPLVGVSRMVDLGIFRLPPYNLGGVSPYDIRLILSAREPTPATNLAFILDYLLFLPCDESEGMSFSTPNGFGLPYQGKLVLDGSSGAAYALDAATGEATAHYSMYGDFPLIEQGKDQRIYIAFDDNASTMPFEWTVKVKMKYRPRRLRI